MALARFDTFIEGLLQREGGYVNHPNDRGGATKYGISSRAHPGLDVANLSKKQASDIYKRDYWDAIGADNLPPRTGEIAADFAINSGVGFAKKALQETGGDPQAMIDYQKQHYANIIKNDPSQKVFEKGWNNRMARLSSAGDASGTGGQVYNAEKPQVQAAQGAVAVDETGQANQGGIENMLAQLEALRPEPMTDMERIGGAIGEGFANQKPYQGMSAAAGFLNAYAAGNRISAREKVANRAYEMKALQMQIEFGKKDKLPNSYQEWELTDKRQSYGEFLADKGRDININTGDENRPTMLNNAEKEQHGYNKEDKPYWYKGQPTLAKKAKPSTAEFDAASSGRVGAQSMDTMSDLRAKGYTPSWQDYAGNEQGGATGGIIMSTKGKKFYNAANAIRSRLAKKLAGTNMTPSEQALHLGNITIYPNDSTEIVEQKMQRMQGYVDGWNKEAGNAAIEQEPDLMGDDDFEAWAEQ